MVFSVPRTGSSLTYNVLRFLFEDEQCLSFAHNDFRLDRLVLKTHKMPEIEILKETGQKILFLITVRDPVQSCISTFRIQPRPVKNMQTFCRKQIERQVNYLEFIENLKAAGYPVLIFRYEDFEKEQSRSLLQFIEEHFSFSVSELDVQTIVQGYSRENIFANIQTLPDFLQMLPISGFHGKHVSITPFTPPEDLLYWLNHYYQEVNWMR
jgi:hypothetical protein